MSHAVANFVTDPQRMFLDLDRLEYLRGNLECTIYTLTCKHNGHYCEFPIQPKYFSPNRANIWCWILAAGNGVYWGCCSSRLLMY